MRIVYSSERRAKMNHLEDVMEEYTDQLFRIAYYYTKDVQAAEDIVQEVFIKYYYTYNHQAHEELKALLAKMTANKCKDYLKSWAYRKLVLYKKLPLLKITDILYESSALEEEVLELPLKFREIITYYYFEGFTTKEISTIIATPESTVKSRLKRGRELLKEKLEGVDFT